MTVTIAPNNTRQRILFFRVDWVGRILFLRVDWVGLLRVISAKCTTTKHHPHEMK